jgi:hypothetical protein
MNMIAYASFRLYGIDNVSISNIKEGMYTQNNHTPRNLEKAKDLDFLLSTSKECWENAKNRRSAIIDKCKTLLTMGSLLLGFIGILLPKSFAFDNTWMRIVCFVAVLALLNTVTLLLVFFGIGRESEISLDQEEIELDSDNLKKNMINLYLQCQSSMDNRTNYLVDLYQVARFFFLMAFSVIVILYSVDFIMSPSIPNQKS